MSWDLTANNPAELANIGGALLNASEQNVLDEQVQMTRLLESLAWTQVFQFPVRARHTGRDAVPDFQLQSGSRRIAVEITKIAVPDVEHARALQQKGLNKILAISSLYRKQNKPRRQGEVITEGFVAPAMFLPVPFDEHDKVWREAAEACLAAKTSVAARSDFQHGDEDWLLLWDRIGTVGWQLGARKNGLTKLLLSHWKPGWFSRVFVQDHHFRWQLMFTASETAEVLSEHPRVNPDF